jgi:glutathione-regulated potassium-efflux system ancillary protein KefG
MNNILIILAHPQLQFSRVNRAMIECAQKNSNVVIHDLYELYPDFCINIKYEQQAVETAQTIIFQYPLQWYSCPAILKEWMDLVLQEGWAYGEKGIALRGKQFLNAITVGGPEASYNSSGYNRFSIKEFLTPFDQTANLCGMTYLEPFILYNSSQLDNQSIERHARKYSALLDNLKG